MTQKPREISDLESLIVKNLRERLGVSEYNAAWLVEQTGIPKATLSKTLNGQRATNLVELQLIANALGIRFSDVVAEAEDAEDMNSLSLASAPIPESDDYELAALDPHYDPEQEQN